MSGRGEEVRLKGGKLAGIVSYLIGFWGGAGLLKKWYTNRLASQRGVRGCFVS